MMTNKQNLDIKQSQSLSKRKTSASLKRSSVLGNDSTNLLQQSIPQHDPKQYSLMIYCFNNNIAQYYVKGFKSMLGQLQQLYKIPVSKQQKMWVDQNLYALVQRNLNKLARDVCARNSGISKNINQYAEGYNRYIKLQQPYQMSTLDNINTIQIAQSQRNQQPKQKAQTTKDKQKLRPFSSNRVARKQYQRMTTNSNNSIRKQPIFRSKDERNLIHTRNIRQWLPLGMLPTQHQYQNQESQCFVYIRENCRKASTKPRFYNNKHQKHISEGTLLQNEQHKYASENNGLVNNSQIIGFSQSNRGANYYNQYIKQTNNLFNNYYDDKYLAKTTNLTKFFNLHINALQYGSKNIRQKSIDQIQREYIQNRILSLNGAGPLTNLTRPQGYKPKSKCWGTAIAYSGKASSQMPSAINKQSTRLSNKLISSNHKK